MSTRPDGVDRDLVRAARQSGTAVAGAVAQRSEVRITA